MQYDLNRFIIQPHHRRPHVDLIPMQINFQTDPESYQHWHLEIDGDVATLRLDVSEDGGLFDGYQLKLNSYDLGVDIELYDATQRLRFQTRLPPRPTQVDGTAESGRRCVSQP